MSSGRPSMWEELETSMRKVLAIRERGPDFAHFEPAAVERCRRRWTWVPRAPEGMTIAWPADLRALAEELGLEPDARGPDEIDARMDARIGGSRPPCHPRGSIAARPSLAHARALRQRIERGETADARDLASVAAEMFGTYRAVAIAGEPAAWRELVECYVRGIGCSPRAATSGVDAREARRRGAEAGDRECGLTWAREELDRPEPDHALLHRVLAPLLADDPDGRAHLIAGYVAFRGLGEPASPSKSASLQRIAAEKGNADAMFELYVHASTGQGMERDEEEALRWCTRAAELGQDRACYNLGAFHATGRGVPQDWAAAVKWYERAAELGNGRAAAALATMYRLGEGVDVDAARAAQWDQVAASRGAIPQVRRE
jgi:hypothetical protein